MRWLRSSVAALGLLFGFLVSGDLLYVAAGAFRIPVEILRQPTRVRTAAPSCLEPTQIHALGRWIQIRLEPEETTLDFTLALDGSNPCTEVLEAGVLEGTVATFVRNAFGQLTLNGEQLPAEAFSHTSTSTEPVSKRVIFQFQARVTRVRYSSIAISHGRSPVADLIGLRWRGVRVTGIFPQPDTLMADGALIRSRPERPVYSFNLSARPLDEKNAAAPRSSSQSFLRRLNETLQAPVLSQGLFGLALIVPFLLFFQRAQPAGPSEFPLSELADTLLASTRALLAFHLSLFFFSAISALPEVNVVQEAGTELAHELAAILPEPAYGILGRGLRYVAFAWVALLSPAILERHQGGAMPERSGGRFLRRLLAGAFAAVAVAGLVAAAVQLQRQGLGAPLWSYFLAAASLGLLLLWVLFLAAGRLAGLRPLGPDLAAAAALAALAGMALDQSALPHRDAVWMAVTVVAGYRLLRSFRAVARSLGAGLPLPSELPVRRSPAIGRLLTVLLAIPATPLVFPGASLASEFSVVGLGFALDGFLVPLFVLGVLSLMRREGQEGLEIAPFTRAAGLVALAAVLFTPSSTWLYIPLTFLMGWLGLELGLIPVRTDEGFRALAASAVHNRRRTFAAILRINTAERGYRGFRQHQLEKLTKGEIGFTDFEAEMEVQDQELAAVRKRHLVADRRADRVALAFGPLPTAWENGVHGALYAALFALPWIVLGIADVLGGPMPQSVYPLWDLARELVFMGLEWTTFGFLLGYFFPYVRGRSGLTKGFFLFLATALPQLLLAAVYRTSPEDWKPLAFLILQTFLHCMLLGLFAFDAVTLRKTGYRDWRLLFEVHGIPAVGASLSSILLAAGTTVAALATSQAKDLVAAAFRLMLPGSHP